jgi:F-type H+-transporting ATPase subunit delta
MTDALSDHYAKALADTIFAPNSGLAAEEANRQLETASSVIASAKDLERLLLSPAISRSRKQAVIGKLADRLGLHRLIKNFLLVIVSHRRIRELRAIQKSFDLIVDERTGWIPAEITSAHELNAEQREQIEHALGTKLGKFIRGHYRVDPSVIGGVRVHVASIEYDATIRGKLEGMRSRLVSHL